MFATITHIPSNQLLRQEGEAAPIPVIELTLIMSLAITHTAHTHAVAGFNCGLAGLHVCTASSAGQE
jgi:hypothetical protein